MPPRKRARISQPASASPASPAKTPTPANESSPTDEQLLHDPWTDEEETALFKALMKWKPTGIHKHFHLFALHQDLLNHGHIHPRNEHTKPAGIWQKLQAIYDLEVLDEREDARQLENVKIPSAFRSEDAESEEDDESGGDDTDVYSEAANKIENEEFSLPGEDFEERKWAQRLASEKERGNESPPLLPELNMANEAPVRFTPSFSIEPSEVTTPTSRRGRGRGGRAAAANTRRSTRQAESGADEDDEEEEEEESSEEEAESEQSTPARRGTRKETRTRADQRGKGRGRGRGR